MPASPYSIHSASPWPAGSISMSKNVALRALGLGSEGIFALERPTLFDAFSSSAARALPPVGAERADPPADPAGDEDDVAGVGCDCARGVFRSSFPMRSFAALTTPSVSHDGRGDDRRSARPASNCALPHHSTYLRNCRSVDVTGNSQRDGYASTRRFT